MTATERVLPRLALDFTTASLDSRVTVSRALDTATRINSSGFIETVNANLPRFDYDPVTVGTCKGLLIEETRANALPSSNDFTNATYWVINGSPTVLADQVSSPDGTTNACTMEVSGASNGFGVYSAATFAAGTYTASLYFKPISGNLVFRLGFSTTSSTINMNTLAIVNGANSVGTVEAGPNGYYRFEVTVTTASTLSLNIYSIGSNTGKMAFYGAQIEVGAFATSYIPTTTTSLMRNADVVSMTGTNFSDWYNQSEGAFLMRQSLIGASGNQSGLTILGTAYNNNSFHYMASYNSTRRPFWLGYTGATNDVSLYLLDAVTLGEQYGVTFAYKENNFAAAKKGETPRTDTSGSVYGSMSQMLIGYGQQYLNGHVQEILYWPQRITDAEVQAFSK